MAGGLQGCRGHPQPDGHQQEGPAAQDDGPVLSEAGPGVLEVWQPAVSCCCGKLKLENFGGEIAFLCYYCKK